MSQPPVGFNPSMPAVDFDGMPPVGFNPAILPQAEPYDQPDSRYTQGQQGGPRMTAPHWEHTQTPGGFRDEMVTAAPSFPSEGGWPPNCNCPSSPYARNDPARQHTYPQPAHAQSYSAEPEPLAASSFHAEPHQDQERLWPVAAAFPHDRTQPRNEGRYSLPAVNPEGSPHHPNVVPRAAPMQTQAGPSTEKPRPQRPTQQSHNPHGSTKPWQGTV